MTLPPALLIAGKDLRLRFRDRSVLMLGFAAPLMIATLMSFAFKGTDSFHVTVVVVDVAVRCARRAGSRLLAT